MAKYKYEMKPLFEERMRKPLKDGGDFDAFEKISYTKSRNWIRANELKIDSDKLFQRLKKKWKVERPFPRHKEIIKELLGNK